jgi:nucleotide-binding universal stress UspA family protein
MIERLLVPLAGDALDARVLSLGIDLARQLGAAITGFIVEPFGGGMPADEASLRAHAQAVLGRFEEQARAAGVPFEGHATQSNDVSGAILAAAEAHRCDMIVMGTHGRGRLAGLLGGSHTRDVLSRTRLPLLVLQ